MIPEYLGGLIFILIIIGMLSLVVYAVLNIFYPKSPRKLKIEASVILGFIILALFSSFTSFILLIVILALGLGLIYGFKKI
ncbi:hypothetical protein [Acidianus brierleyi]|uniref:Uncharacterized protein n=1 Tax=Acidianus brierleyi TaxID=41673 RepID=A0A2U9II79_9CREN|nr:hypothetical protein [Acidianus brierleyi]AWR95720.1 hypothetical protein DFR85_15130 [Acidianus brierleyi]